MSSTSRRTGSNKPLFSVFSDENADGAARSAPSQPQKAPASSSASSSSSLPIPSKRIKTGGPLSSKPTTTGLYSASSRLSKSDLPTASYSKTRTALSTKPIAVLADKENVNPDTGKQKTSGKDKAKDGSSLAAKADLWKGKQPFEFASPEKVSTALPSKRGASTKYIYDLPGVEASRHVTSKSALQTSSNPPPARLVGSNMAISKPNKKNRPIVAPSIGSGAFNTFKDDTIGEDCFAVPRTIASSSGKPVNRRVDALVQPQILGSPVTSVKAADRRAKELTESPLADVTLAYTGRGRFSNSPTADSGFGSRGTSLSPLHSARSFIASTGKLSGSLLEHCRSSEMSPSQITTGTLGNSDDLPGTLNRLAISSLSTEEALPTKRRISQLSNLSRSGRASTSYEPIDDSRLLQHVNEDDCAELDRFASDHLLDGHSDVCPADSEGQAEEEEEDSPDLLPNRALPVNTSKTYLVQPNASQPMFGKRTSIPTRKALSMRI